MKSFYPTPSELPLLLDGRQNALVRPMNPRPGEDAHIVKIVDRPGQYVDIRDSEFFDGKKEVLTRWNCPFGAPETELWCKERWWYDWKSFDEGETELCYAHEQAYGEIGVEWKPSITMPKSACRLWLKVLEVKVCKLMDLTNEEMYETGVRISDCYQRGISPGNEGSVEAFNLGDGIRRMFYEIFDEKFGKRKVTNPWIWYCSVSRIEKP